MLLNFGLMLQFLLQDRALKLLELHIDPKELKIEIQAGTDGILGIFLRLLGIDTQSGYTVDATGCRRTGNGLFNLSRTFAPLQNLSAAVYFLVKPIGALIAGLFFAWSTLGWLMFAYTQGPGLYSLTFSALFGTLALAFLWKFIAGDRIAVLGVMTNSGAIVSIKLKAKSIDFRALMQAYVILENLVNRANFEAGITHSSPQPGELPHNSDDKLDDLDELEDADDSASGRKSGDEKSLPLAQRNQTTEAKCVIQCPHCEAKLRLNASILGSRIRCPSCQEPFVAT